MVAVYDPEACRLKVGSRASLWSLEIYVSQSQPYFLQVRSICSICSGVAHSKKLLRPALKGRPADMVHFGD